MSSIQVRRSCIAVACVLSLGVSATGCLAQQAATDTTPISIPRATRAPRGAIVLFDGTEASLKANWYKRRSKEDANWTVSPDGVMTPAKVDITSKQEFGDCYLHVEFCEPMTGGGNAGVGLQGRYEIQILNSYGQKPEEHNCGAFYSQKKPIVMASKKAGEWQTYDIIFRAPRFDANGQVVEKARATVIHNGIVVQNNNEFNGPTGIQYEELKGETPTGPIVLQGDHDPVQYRNVWIVPIGQ